MAERNTSTRPLSSLISDPFVSRAFERAERDERDGDVSCNINLPTGPFIPPSGELRIHVCQKDVSNDVRQGSVIGLRTTEEFIRDGRYLDVNGNIWLAQSTISGELLVKTLAEAERGERATLVNREAFEETIVGFVYGIMKIIDLHMALNAA